MNLMSLFDLWRPHVVKSGGNARVISVSRSEVAPWHLWQSHSVPNGASFVSVLLPLGVPHQRHVLGLHFPCHLQEIQQVLWPAGTLRGNNNTRWPFNSWAVTSFWNQNPTKWNLSSETAAWPPCFGPLPDMWTVKWSKLCETAPLYSGGEK